MARVFCMVLLLAIVIVAVSATCRYDSNMYDTSKIIPYECYHYTPAELERHRLTGLICDKPGLIYTLGNNGKYPGCAGSGCHCCREKEPILETGDTLPSADGCYTCTCLDDGSMECKSNCGVLACHPRLVQSNKGECCPTCREGCWDEALGHQDVGLFKPAGGCGKCTCHNDGSITCVGETCQALTCDAHAVEMNDALCCPKCIGCIIDGGFVAAGDEYKGKDPCKTCQCKQNGLDTTVKCKTQSCTPCGEEYNTVPLTGVCCPRCDPKPVCTAVKCAKLRCGKRKQFQTEDMCCPQCMCKHRGKLVFPGVIGDKCDGKMCNGDTGKKTRTTHDCPKNIMCANPVQNKDTCCYDCPDETITCMHPRTKKIITKGQYISSRRQICTCLGDPWFPYAFCAKRKLKRRDFRGFKNNFAEYMEGGNSPA